MCSFNRVLTGRCHSGDENGKTWFEDAELEAVDESGNLVSGVITVSSSEWSEWAKESSGQGFDALNNHVIVGREHKGDENGMTRYQTGVLRYKGKLVRIVPYPNADMCVYASHKKMVYPKNNLVIIGIKHSGDENGITTYCQGYIVADK